jgi:ABC-type multidrug transport system fused ATPase/permease subunit
VLKQLNEPLPQIFMALILMLSLFMAESWTLGNAPDSTNVIMDSVLLAIFIIFVIETFVLSFVQDGYLWSFFFWMDVIGTLSIILDIGFIADSFIPSGALSGQGSVIRATRAAKLGARYGRLLRLMRLMKLTSFLPCFPHNEEDDYEPTMTAIKKVSEELSNMLSLRTAALTMLLVIVVPFMSYTVTDYSPNAWGTNFKVIAKNETTTLYDIQNLGRKCDNFYRPKDAALLDLKVESPWTPLYEEHYDTRSVLRDDNVVEYEFEYFVEEAVLAASDNPYAQLALTNGDTTTRPGSVRFTVNLNIDDTKHYQMNSMFNILIIVLVIVVLVGFTASYSSAVNRTVVQPLEKMMSTLRNSAMLMINSLKVRNPFALFWCALPDRCVRCEGVFDVYSFWRPWRSPTTPAHPTWNENVDFRAEHRARVRLPCFTVLTVPAFPVSSCRSWRPPTPTRKPRTRRPPP